MNSSVQTPQHETPQREISHTSLTPPEKKIDFGRNGMMLGKTSHDINTKTDMNSTVKSHTPDCDHSTVKIDLSATSVAVEQDTPTEMMNATEQMPKFASIEEYLEFYTTEHEIDAFLEKRATDFPTDDDGCPDYEKIRQQRIPVLTARWKAHIKRRQTKMTAARFDARTKKKDIDPDAEVVPTAEREGLPSTPEGFSEPHYAFLKGCVFHPITGKKHIHKYKDFNEAVVDALKFGDACGGIQRCLITRKTKAGEITHIRYALRANRVFCNNAGSLDKQELCWRKETRDTAPRNKLGTTAEDRMRGVLWSEEMKNSPNRDEWTFDRVNIVLKEKWIEEGAYGLTPQIFRYVMSADNDKIQVRWFPQDICPMTEEQIAERLEAGEGVKTSEGKEMTKEEFMRAQADDDLYD